MAETLPQRMSEEAMCALLLEADALDIRDVDAGEEPFHYSSGNFGPGYVDVKGTVGKQSVFTPLIEQVAVRLIEDEVPFDHIVGNATGGMVPAYATREAFQRMTGRTDVEYAYVRGARKQGGQGELVSGLTHLPPHQADGSPSRILVMEELVNYAETTVNSLLLFRRLGFAANRAATILFYGHDAAIENLETNGVALTHLVKLSSLVDVAEETGKFSAAAIAGYRESIAGPKEWMEARGLVNVPHQKA